MGTRLRSVLALFLLVTIFKSSQQNQQCKPKQIDGAESVVCVCTADYCDKYNFEFMKESGDVKVANPRVVHIETTKAGARLRQEHELLQVSMTNLGASSKNEGIHVDVGAERQTIIGYGGAVTDAAAINYNNLPSDQLKRHLVDSYYGSDKGGLQYNLARVTMAGSDFSNRTYSYDDTADDQQDLELKRWQLTAEDSLKIDLIKQIKQNTDSLKLFSSPWSPPRWMKTSKSFVRGHLLDSAPVYSAYAKYLVKFFDAYRQRGIEFWAATVQNEPVSAQQATYFFNSLEVGGNEQAKFVADYLGPALEAAGYLSLSQTKDSDLKLLLADDGLTKLEEFVDEFRANKRALSYFSGFAFHWYGKAANPYSQISKIFNSVRSDKLNFSLMTEACSGWEDNGLGVNLGNWTRAQDYASDIIEDLQQGAAGWVDWNLALDLQGGPNWAKNYVDSPVVIDVKSQLFYKQPMYYALAHFSMFLQTNDKVLATKVEGFEAVKAVAAGKAAKKQIVLNVLNMDDKDVSVPVAVSNCHSPTTAFAFNFKANLKAKSINTFVVSLS